MEKGTTFGCNLEKSINTFWEGLILRAKYFVIIVVKDDNDGEKEETLQW